MTSMIRQMSRTLGGGDKNGKDGMKKALPLRVSSLSFPPSLLPLFFFLKSLTPSIKIAQFNGQFRQGKLFRKKKITIKSSKPYLIDE